MSAPRVAIVGGGLAGLTVARQLNIKSPARAVDVEVFEASERVGGVIESSTVDGFLREHAANGVLGTARGGAADLAADLGLEMIAASPAAKKRWVYSRGKLREVPSGPLALAKSDLLSARGKLRLFAEPTRAALTGEPTVAEFFRHRLGDEVHDQIVAPFVSGIYAGDTEELSMPAAFPRVSELSSRVGLFRGLLGEKISARRRGGTGDAAARQTSAPAGGMEAIIFRLAEKLTGRIRLGEPVVSLERSTRGVDLITESGRVEHFDAAVCAVQSHVAAPMFAASDAELAELLAMIPSAAVAVVHLGFRRRDVGHPLDGFGFLGAPADDLAILGVVFESSIWPERAPEDCVLLRVMIGGRRRPELALGDPAEIVGSARKSCEEILDARGAPIHENVVQWPRAIAQYTVGHRERVERAEILAAEQGVVLAGSSYHGVAVNSVTGDAVRVARRVHELLAAPLALLLFVLLASSPLACSSAGRKSPAAGDDGGQQAPPPGGDEDAVDGEPTLSATFAAGYEIIEVNRANAGTVEVRVVAPNPPAALVDSGGLNSCKSDRASQLTVDTLGGVEGAVVWLEDVGRGRAKTTAEKTWRVRLSDCRLKPRVSVVGRLDSTLEVATASEVRRQLAVSVGAASGELEPIATLPMAPIGRGFAIPMNRAGLYRTSGDGIDGAWVVVHGTPYVAATDGKGVARLTGVPAGTYSLRLWHPPLAGKSVTEVVKATVVAGKTARLTIDLSAQLPQAKGPR